MRNTIKIFLLILILIFLSSQATEFTVAENHVESIFFYSRETTMKPYLKVTIAEVSSDSGTNVGGIIWSDTIWTLEGSPYNITERVEIPAGVTLTIEPGVIVTKPSSGTDLFLLQGTIFAHGTSDNKITFDGGGNSGFFSAADSDINAFLDLDSCIIKNGFYFWWAGHGSFSLKHSELYNLSYFSYIWGPGKDVYIEYNTFVNTYGFSTGHSDANVYIRYNLFKGKYPRLRLQDPDFYIQNWASKGSSETIVKYNSFIDIDENVLKILPASGVAYVTAAISATENYWGTMDTDVIDSMIYDKKDDINCASFIEYLPILSEPHPNTPKIVTTLSCSVSLSEVNLEIPITVSGTIDPPLPEKIVTLTFTKPDGSTLKKHIFTDSNGSYSDTCTLDVDGSWSVTASWGGDSTHEGSSSSEVHFTVNSSLIGGPGWIDDIAVFGGISLIAIASLILILRKVSTKNL